jgi:hypothetical protein
MTASQVEASEASRGPRRWRYLIDIVVLVAATFLLDAVLSAFVQVPINLDKGLVFDAIGKVLLVGVGCGLVLLRGERLADIGLKRPASWMRTFMIGIGLAAIVFIAMYLSEKAGFRRDLSKFKDVQGNLELAVLGVFYALIVAGFYEEFTVSRISYARFGHAVGWESRRMDRCLCGARRALRAGARLPESSWNRNHGDAWRIDGTAGSCFWSQSLARNNRAWAVRCQSLHIVLLSRAADWLTFQTLIISDSAGANQTRNQLVTQCGCV